MSVKRTRQINTSQKHKMMGPPNGAMRGPVEKAKDFKGTLRRLIRYLRPQLPKIIIVFIFAIASTIFTVKAPKISGDAVNQLTDGFIAKSMVSGISTAQDKAVPEIKKQLQKINDMENTVTEQVKTKVNEEFNKNINDKKQQAYAQAEQKANKMVEQKFNDEITAKKQQAYAQAEQKANQMAEQKFNEQMNIKKQQAYDQAESAAKSAAKTAVDTQFKSMYPDISESSYSSIDAYNTMLEQAQSKAAAEAKSKVDATFAAQQSAMQSELTKVKSQAVASAKKAVDDGFAKQQPSMNAKLADAKKQAVTQAKAAVDKAFTQQSAEMQSGLIKAQQQAVSKAQDQVKKQILEKGKITDSQLKAMQDMANLPLIKNINDNNKKADTIKQFIDLGKKMPASSQKKEMNISKSELDRGIKDIRENGGKIPFAAIGKTLLFLLFIYLLSSLCSFIMQYMMSGVAQKTVYKMREEVDDKISKLPLKYFDTHTNGEILSRMTNDIDTISTTLQQSLTQLITSLLQIIGYIWMMISISFELTLVVLATLPLYILTTSIIAKHSQKLFTSQQEHLGELSGHTEEMYTGHVIVKAFGHEDESIKTFKSINDDLYDSGWKAQFMSGIMFPLMNFISNVGYVLIAVVGGIFVTKNRLNLGDITAFIQYSKSFSMPIVQTANIANVIQSTIACAERVFEVLDEEEEQPDVQNAASIIDPQGDIQFNHVQFSYKKDEPLIEDMNLDIKKGDTIAIVGPTGAGKTTLINLLMRFYEIQNGSITFDGIDIRKLRRGDLRTEFGMVLQDTWLFNGTIRDNIAYGRDNATDQEIVSAAKAAYADHFIRSLPEGYNTILNEEATNISQGQKQLLTIARAILANPAVLILDEATSSVDTRTEVLIQKAMGRLMKDRTSFVIAHRLSTIRDAQMILVMNHGSIVEKGNHNELIEKGGFYADLYNSQFLGVAT